MRAELRIPPAPDLLRAVGCTPDAIATRERFVRSAADAWVRAGDAATACRVSDAADALRARFSAAAMTARAAV